MTVRPVERPLPAATTSRRGSLEHWSCSDGPGPPWRSFCGMHLHEPIIDRPDSHDLVDCVVCVDVAAAIVAGRVPCPSCGRMIEDHK